MALIIKGKHITDFKALKRAVIMGANDDEIMPKAARELRGGACVLEWRIDFFDEYLDYGIVRKTLGMLKRFCDDAILLAAIRTKPYGGNASISGNALAMLYDEIAQSHAADLLDVETDSLCDPKSAIDSLHDRGQLVVTSSPILDESTFNYMQELEADLGRITENDTWKIFI